MSPDKLSGHPGRTVREGGRTDTPFLRGVRCPPVRHPSVRKEEARRHNDGSQEEALSGLPGRPIVRKTGPGHPKKPTPLPACVEESRSCAQPFRRLSTGVSCMTVPMVSLP